MKVLVTTPYGKDSLQGNTVTAKRVVSILEETGVDASVISSGDEAGNADVLIALHAKKSAHFIDDFLAVNPSGKVIVYLTGTDLYSDVPNGCPVSEKSMEIADGLVVSQRSSLASVSERYRAKTVVVHKSIQLSDVMSDQLERDPNLFTFIGHLRAVKQPFMSVESIQLLNDSLKLVLLGRGVDEDSEESARNWQLRDPRFQWLGGVNQEVAHSWMKRSLATINTSLSEGGANSVGESIVLGIPVLASKIEGNIGMLGEDYAGYFSANSREELAGLMHRVLHDASFLETLSEQVRVRSGNFLRENERKDWMNLIQKIT